MQPEARKALAYYLAEYSARHRGVTLPEDSRGTQVGYLVRGGCTLAPDAYLFTVIDRAIIAEASRLPNAVVVRPPCAILRANTARRKPCGSAMPGTSPAG